MVHRTDALGKLGVKTAKAYGLEVLSRQGVRNVNSLLFSTIAIHRLEDTIEVVTDCLHAAHKSDFKIRVARENSADCFPVLRGLIEDWK